MEKRPPEGEGAATEERKRQQALAQKDLVILGLSTVLLCCLLGGCEVSALSHILFFSSSWK